MTALSSGLGGQEKFTYGRMSYVLTGAKVFQGSRIGMYMSGANKGKVTKFTSALNLFYLGVAYLGSPNASIDATGSDKVLQVDPDLEVTGLTWRPQGATPVQTSHLLQMAYYADDNCVVPGSSDLGVSPAGRIMGVDSVKGVLILPPFHQAFAANFDVPTPGPALAFTAADIVLNGIIDGVTYEVPTSAANSTITLPAATNLPDGVKCNFFADGTKNGHTVQYRVGATAITAAQAASKRHFARFETRSGLWFCTGIAAAP